MDEPKTHFEGSWEQVHTTSMSFWKTSKGKVALYLK
jgi:hypothetical protein